MLFLDELLPTQILNCEIEIRKVIVYYLRIKGKIGIKIKYL